MTHKTKIILGIAALVLVAGVVYVEYPKQEEGPKACTMEAKLCPDGSSVGRTGPNCDFAVCPTSTTTASIGQTITVEGVSITPLEVAEDSRCPMGVMCIQAGTVRLKVKLETQGKVQEETIKLSQAVSFGGKQITLDLVAPLKFAGKTIAPADYRFNFSVKDSVSADRGTLKGNVTIGPVCPVENSAGYSCTPTAEMYAAAKVFVYQTDRVTLVSTISPDKNGNFSVSLPAGKYFIDMIHQSIGGTTGVPTTIDVSSGKTVTLSLHVDTGLR